MIKTLQRRFIFTAMLAITILLVLLTAAISLVNAINENNRAGHVLTRLARTEVMPPREMHPPREPRFAPPVSTDDAMSARFFVVYFNDSGEITRADVHRISAVTADEAGTIASKVYSEKTESGRYKHFRYLAQPTDAGGTAMIFLDCSMYTRGIFAVLIISFLLAAICWLLMLFVVIILSKNVLRPVVVGLEKQKQFVTDAGHEIKTPLAIIRSNTEALELYNGESKWSKNIKNQITRLSGLTESLLTLARLDEAPTVIISTELCLSEVIEETLLPFTEMAEDKDIAVYTDIAPQIMIKGSRDQLARMVSALAENAVKYSPNGGTIAFSLKSDGHNAVFVSENSCDNLPEDCSRLFDRFYRGDSARTQKSGGFGVGLSVARSVVEAHRGKITADCKDERILFTVTIPCR